MSNVYTLTHFGKRDDNILNIKASMKIHYNSRLHCNVEHNQIQFVLIVNLKGTS